MKKHFFFSLALSVSTSAIAAESLNTKVHNQYQSLRAMGMGNAFTTVADDYSALMYNPAVLARKKRGEIQFTLAGAGVSASTLTIMKDITDAEKNAVGDSAKSTAISNVLDQYYGKPLGARLQAVEMFWVRPNWGIALIPLDLTIDMTVNRQLGPALDLNIKKDTTIAYGYGKQITPFLSAGVLAKFIHRDSVEQSVSALELATDPDVLSKDRFKEGTNIDAELGLIWTPEFTTTVKVTKTAPADDLKIETKPATPSSGDESAAKTEKTDQEKQDEEAKRNPQSEIVAENSSSDVSSADQTVAAPVEEKKPEVAAEPETKTEIIAPLAFSLVTRNLINSEFTKSTMVNKDATTAPTKNSRTIDLGVGYDLSTLGDLKIRLTAEAKNLMHPNTTVRKSTHAGFEIDYSPGTWFKTQFRAGLNQMYFTAGATLLLGIVEIDAVTYGEEIGTSTTNVENRVNAIKVGFNF